MNSSLLRYLLEHEIRIAIQTANEYFPKEFLENRCKCLRLGNYNNISDAFDLEDDIISLDTAWRKF